MLHEGVLDLDVSECKLSRNSIFQIASMCPRLIKLDLSAPRGSCRNEIKSDGELSVNCACVVIAICGTVDVQIFVGKNFQGLNFQWI